MPKKNKYPKWFSPYSKPSLPGKPQLPPKEIIDYTEITSWNAYSSKRLKMEDVIATKADCIGIEHTYCGYEADSPKLVAYKEKLIPNPAHAPLMIQYALNLKRYREEQPKIIAQRKQWDELKARWDAEKAEEQKSLDLKQLSALKAKYEAPKSPRHPT